MLYGIEGILNGKLFGNDEGGSGGDSGGGGGNIDSLIDRSITEVNTNRSTIGAYVFYDCRALTVVNIPNATEIMGNAFNMCAALETIVLPNVSNVSSSAFSTCSKLRLVDFHVTTTIGANAFTSDTKLSALILRGNEVSTLINTNALKGSSAYQNTMIAKGTGYIYVPSALVEDYKVASNWSTFAAQFRALEDYTVDGTISGELDESKI